LFWKTQEKHTEEIGIATCDCYRDEWMDNTSNQTLWKTCTQAFCERECNKESHCLVPYLAFGWWGKWLTGMHIAKTVLVMRREIVQPTQFPQHACASSLLSHSELKYKVKRTDAGCQIVGESS
jgi:hypothetical protein